MASRRRFLLGVLALGLAPGPRAETDDTWQRLRRGGYVILLRHASTEPGLGDPPNLRLDDCATQRNLSEQGREEARRLAAALRTRRIPIGRVYTSPWCRCRETAQIAFGSAEDWEPLSSIFDFPDREARYSESVRRRIANHAGRLRGANLAMVTHNVNIAALTRLSVAPCELVVVRPDGCCGLRVAGRLTA